ncbi:unnamed protein product [Medioppia subpectinata]|uniref:VWFA domain-containing protein n=1 Tax=Medioppia subpectinata TaxID=1979941 RepID=A0A7R9PWY9_9ACAR|nr:unnamed protein product [Medioppia subpectinata]CAG2103837.1 unnamed protein product [Medioppia subpectinata]
MSERIVFVLDVSRSMRGVRIKALHTETARSIDRIHDGNYVGIVLFNKTAWTAHELTMITSQSVRQSLVAAVPTNYKAKGTDIKAGIMEALAVLKRARVQTKGAKIFLATDGDQTVGNKDYVSDVLPHLRNAQVNLYCLAIGVNADPNLERLTAVTGEMLSSRPRSQVFSSNRADGKSTEMLGQVMEAAMKEVITSKEMAEVVTHTVVNEVVVINGNTYETRVPIEADIGRNTQIQIRSEAIKDIDVDITGPSGVVYSTTGGGQIDKRLDVKECRIYFKSTESGLWTIKLTKQISSPVRAHLVLESNPTGAKAIDLQVFQRPPEINCPPIVVCRLCKGNDPIVGAIVTATVDRPGGTQTDLPLNIYHKEGYYYAYFTDYSVAGRYNVSALAVNDSNNTIYHGTPTGPFRRQRVASSFQVKTDCMPTQLPLDDHFNQLLLTNQFGYQRNTPVCLVSTNTVRDTKPLPVPALRNIPLLSDQMKALKTRLSTNYIRTKRAVDGLQASEKADLVNKLSAFEHFFSSIRETSAEEIDGYQRRLDEINEQVTLRKQAR